MLRYLPLILAVALIIYCVFDVLGSDERARRGLPTTVWLLIVLLPFVGGVVWLVVRRRAPHAGAPGARGGGPVAPDDDPEFLFRLDQERRRRQRQDGSDRPDDGSTADGSSTADGPPAA
ncbi:PLD nuclease N-terminal domain-containing protein [Cellulomonas wangsupingiae]|uniref:PLD nuclease N-terminal domain-containing protein n=1 Tax=Cellulomonas wangsupingiae TaxID=2968085 RepID=A0ABY5K3A3_9CELL|nr:PLD nuclease N-terminal domain-containing protein [Cellulomonas wangsupingiae]MCC2335564.1 PLD nuclease N-terminal domain-containing protein [Cellulomonas wangsupingiae]UUI64269.1 PLD nuclease N-terminal domain-containing protein [Cellulomonas wangsupingiae]